MIAGIWEMRSRPDDWDVHPAQDARFNGLLRLSNVICDVFDYAAGDCEDAIVEMLPTPLELASMLREAADQIQAMTRPSPT
jgi:hypothetical protein